MRRTTAPGNRIIRTVYRPVWTGNVGSIVTIPNPGVYTCTNGKKLIRPRSFRVN